MIRSMLMCTILLMANACAPQQNQRATSAAPVDVDAGIANCERIYAKSKESDRELCRGNVLRNGFGAGSFPFMPLFEGLAYSRLKAAQAYDAKKISRAKLSLQYVALTNDFKEKVAIAQQELNQQNAQQKERDNAWIRALQNVAIYNAAADRARVQRANEMARERRNLSCTTRGSSTDCYQW